MPEPASQILIYQPEDGRTRIDVRLEGETVWLTQAQMVLLFQSSKQNISLHVRNIFSEGELQENSVVKEYLTTAADGKNYRTNYYNLDVIIAIGYRGPLAAGYAIPAVGDGAPSRVSRQRLYDGRRAAQVGPQPGGGVGAEEHV